MLLVFYNMLLIIYFNVISINSLILIINFSLFLFYHFSIYLFLSFIFISFNILLSFRAAILHSTSANRANMPSSTTTGTHAPACNWTVCMWSSHSLRAHASPTSCSKRTARCAEEVRCAAWEPASSQCSQRNSPHHGVLYYLFYFYCFIYSTMRRIVRNAGQEVVGLRRREPSA